jgi:hypothetical protein
MNLESCQGCILRWAFLASFRDLMQVQQDQCGSHGTRIKLLIQTFYSQFSLLSQLRRRAQHDCTRLVEEYLTGSRLRYTIVKPPIQALCATGQTSGDPWPDKLRYLLAASVLRQEFWSARLPAHLKGTKTGDRGRPLQTSHADHSDLASWMNRIFKIICKDLSSFEEFVRGSFLNKLSTMLWKTSAFKLNRYASRLWKASHTTGL